MSPKVLDHLKTKERVVHFQARIPEGLMQEFEARLGQDAKTLGLRNLNKTSWLMAAMRSYLEERRGKE